MYLQAAVYEIQRGRGKRGEGENMNVVQGKEHTYLPDHFT